MRYYLHIRVGLTRIEDPEGGEFADLQAAKADVVQATRELLAERLIDTRTITDDDCFEIADEYGTIQAVVPLRSALRALAL